MKQSENWNLSRPALRLRWEKWMRIVFIITSTFGVSPKGLRWISNLRNPALLELAKWWGKFREYWGTLLSLDLNGKPSNTSDGKTHYNRVTVHRPCNPKRRNLIQGKSWSNAWILTILISTKRKNRRKAEMADITSHVRKTEPQSDSQSEPNR